MLVAAQATQGHVRDRKFIVNVGLNVRCGHLKNHIEEEESFLALHFTRCRKNIVATLNGIDEQLSNTE